jgi:TM2 domain-containing membrane protein YozV
LDLRKSTQRGLLEPCNLPSRILFHEQGDTFMSSQPNLNPQEIFYQQYEAVRRDEVVGILLALFLGAFGIHHFYLRRTGLGILYCCFCWTGIPSFLGFIECFFMPERVRQFNAIQAAEIASMLRISGPGWGQPFNGSVNAPAAAQSDSLVTCPRCGRTNVQGSRFCSDCGATL